MALKKAIVSFTKESGETVTRQIGIKSVVFDYKTASIETIFEVYPSEAARSRGGVPEHISQRIPINLADPEDLTMILAVSERLWSKIATAPIVDDYSELDEDTGRQVGNRKTLSELGASIIDAM